MNTNDIVYLRVDRKEVFGMTQDQIHYQQLMEEKRHNVEAERIAASEIAEKQRSTSVSERWYKDQIAIKEREQSLKEAQYKTHKSEWAAEYLQHSIGQFLGERQNSWNRFVDAYGMAKKALFS